MSCFSAETPFGPSLPERVASSYQQLAAVAGDLNAVSDTLGKYVSELDAALKKLNLGITVWDSLRASDDPRTQHYWSEDLGYAKIGGKWGIALRTVSGNYNYPDEDEIESWLFNDAPRQLRLAAIGKIPDLFQVLSEKASETTHQIIEKLEETEELVKAVKKASAEPPKPGGSPFAERRNAGEEVTISAMSGIIPNGVLLFLGFIVIVAAILVWYALYSKSEVMAIFSHGSTVFRLEAKAGLRTLGHIALQRAERSTPLQRTESCPVSRLHYAGRHSRGGISLTKR